MNAETSILTPFFEDTRPVVARLQAERRDWIPTKATSGSPELLAGLVLELGSYTGLNDKVSPTFRLLDSENVEWSVIGFHGFLRSEIARHNPRVGDWVAVAFNGTKAATKAGESDSFVYRLVVERNPAAPYVPDSAADELAAPAGPPADRELVSVAADTPTVADDDIPF